MGACGRVHACGGVCVCARVPLCTCAHVCVCVHAVLCKLLQEGRYLWEPLGARGIRLPGLRAHMFYGLLGQVPTALPSPWHTAAPVCSVPGPDQSHRRQKPSLGGQDLEGLLQLLLEPSVGSDDLS